MAFIRNDSGRDMRGPDNYVIAPGEVREVPEKWLRAREDRIRRGYFTRVAEPAAEPELQADDDRLVDLSDFVGDFGEEE